MKKNLIWAGSITLLFLLLDLYLNTRPITFWTLFSVIFSFSSYTIFSFFLSGCFLYRYSRLTLSFLSILVLFPILNFFYYQNYASFISAQLITALTHEPLFLFAILKMQLLPYWLYIVAPAIVFTLYSYKMLKQTFGNYSTTLKPFFLFKKYFFIIPILVLWAIQIKWCLKYNPTQLFTRTFYIWGAATLISLIGFAIKLKSKNLKRALLGYGFIICIGLFTLIGPAKDYLHKTCFDTQFIIQTFNSFFTPMRNKSLKQTDKAQQKYENYQAPDIPFSLLIVVNDALRASNLGIYGYKRNTDGALADFYKKSFVFQALSPANYTDTSIPSMFTGQGPQRHPSFIKDSLTLWDYFPKHFFSFYVLTSSKNWANIKDFLLSFNMKHLWSTADDAGVKDSLDYTDDKIAIEHILQLLAQHPQFVGVFHANSMHFPYYQKENFTPYQPCETERKNWPQTSVNCYDNAIYYLSHLENQLFKTINLENTIIIITSDHGEGFGEHGSYFHNQDMHQESIRVPFIWYIPPGLIKKIPTENWQNFKNNQKRYVSTTDIIPTILHLASLLSKEAIVYKQEDFTGKSLFANQSGRVVISSGCFVDYRCFKRDVVFADENYFVLLQPNSLNQLEIFSANDFEQKIPLNKENINIQKLENIISQAPEIHPLGAMLTNLSGKLEGK